MKISFNRGGAGVFPKEAAEKRHLRPPLEGAPVFGWRGTVSFVYVWGGVSPPPGLRSRAFQWLFPRTTGDPVVPTR